MRIRSCPALLLNLCLLAPVFAAAAPGTFVIAPQQSWIHVLVYRAGLLSGLGHNHVVSTSELDGSIVMTGSNDARAELTFQADSMVVDDPILRDQYGDDFPGHVSAGDIEGTRRNMLGRKLLQADDYKQVTISAQSLTDEMGQVGITARVTVKGYAGDISFPATVDRSGNSMEINGTASFTHEDIGPKPFSAAFGTVKVEKIITVKFRITAVAE